MRLIGVRTVAFMVAFIGAVNLFTAIRHTKAASFAGPIDGGVPGRAQMLVIGLLLLTIARGLVRLRRAAWIGGIVTVCCAMFLCIPQHRPIAALFCGAALIDLVLIRSAFLTRPDPGRMRTAAYLSLVAILAALTGGIGDAMANRHHPGGAGRIVLADFSTGHPGNIRAMIIAITLGAAIVAAVIVAFAPARAPEPGTAGERAVVRELVAHEDADSLAPFATRADKTYVFSPDGRAAIGYRVIFGTALVGGDPVGAVESAEDAMRAYLALCTEHGWRPAVLGASDEMRMAWCRLGMRGLRIGDEAVLDVAGFSLESRRMRNLRQAVNRTRNAGVTVTITRPTAVQAEQLAPVLAHWLHGAREHGFAMNLDAILTPRPDCLIATAYGRDGEPVAFARFALAADGTCYTLDVAPRGRNAPNGVAERLIVEIVEYAREHGGREVSLNFAALRWIFASRSVGARVSVMLMHSIDRWVEVGPLNRFCEKFAPSWRARSLLLGSWFELAWVVAAALRAEFGSSVASPSSEPTPVAVIPRF